MFLNRDLIQKNSGLWTLAKVNLNGIQKPVEIESGNRNEIRKQKGNPETEMKSGNRNEIRKPKWNPKTKIESGN